MSVVTIAHAAFSGGNAIAEKVASLLNYRSVAREVLIEASKRYGIPEAKYTEVLEGEGHWWERWRESVRLYGSRFRPPCVKSRKEVIWFIMAAPASNCFPGFPMCLRS